MRYCFDLLYIRQEGNKESKLFEKVQSDIVLKEKEKQNKNSMANSIDDRSRECNVCYKILNNQKNENEINVFEDNKDNVLNTPSKCK